MADPKYHGILGAEYSTDQGSTWTTINNVQEENSGISFEGIRSPVTDAYGNNYSGPRFWAISLRALDLTAYSALKTEHDNDTGVRLRFDLDNSAQFTMDQDHLVDVMRSEIRGPVEGRADAFMIDGVSVPDSDVTIA